MQLEPYLHLDGTCEEALHFYAGVFGGEITGLNRVEGSPVAAELPPEAAQKIMHASFKSPGVAFMAADRLHGEATDGANRVSLSVSTNDVEEGRRVFAALAEGGTITVPFEPTFWGATFGMLTDKYKVDWMVNAG